MSFSLDEQIKAVEKWQNCEFVHPLVCGNNFNHSLLVPKRRYAADYHGEFTDNPDWISLVCTDCNYEQDYIPEYVFGLTYVNLEKIEEILNSLKKKSNDK